MLKTALNIILISALAGFAQTGNGSLLYDIGIMINDTTKTTEGLTPDSNGEPILDQSQAALEEELNHYQQQLAETEIRLRSQTKIIDSLQTEITMIKAARETDMALMSTKITALVNEKERSTQQPHFVPGENSGSDNEFAELDTPWKNVTLNTRSIPSVATEPKLSITEEQNAYRQGLTKFHQQYYYQAIDEFNTIVHRGTDMTLRANSQYWVGRCYYEKGLYDDAIRALEQVQRFEYSDKRDDALVMIGLSFKNKDRLAEAKLAFQELVTRHPGSEYLTLARRFVQD